MKITLVLLPTGLRTNFAVADMGILTGRSLTAFLAVVQPANLFPIRHVGNNERLQRAIHSGVV